MTDAELVVALRDLSHDPRVVRRNASKYGRLADVLRFTANEIEALSLPPDESECGFTWQGASGERYRCVRAPDHPREDRPLCPGGHTALSHWRGR